MEEDSAGNDDLGATSEVTTSAEEEVTKSAEEEVTTSAEFSAGVSTPPPDILELTHVYEALGHSRRRYLCYTLLEETDWTLDDLALKVAAWESDIPEHEVTTPQQEEVYVSLYHAHVPKLVDEGVLTFDDATETITTAENAEQVLIALEGMGASLDSNQESHARGEMDDSQE